MHQPVSNRDRARSPVQADDIAALVVTSVALAVYAPCLGGEFLWDDAAHVTRLGLQGWSGLARIWFEIGATQEYYPVLHSAFWVQHRLWGEAVVPYHVVNVLFHAANCCLLALVLRRLLALCGTSLPKLGPLPGEWLAALLFAVHPACVESVAWITEQKNTLSTLFYLGAAYCYLDFSATGRRSRYVWAFCLFLLALGAKPMTVTLAPALLVISWLVHGRLVWRRDVRPLIPWLVAALGAGLLTMHVEGELVGADSVVPDLPLWQRTLLAARIFWFYVGTLLWPADLTFFYPLWDVDKEAIGWTPHLLAGLLLVFLAWSYRGRSRAPLAALLLYGGTLFPVLGFLKVFGFSFSYVADHFPYLAIPIALATLTCGSVRLLARISRPVWIGPGLAAALLAVLAGLSFRQSSLYQSDLTLFQANVTANPASWMGHHVLAHALAKTRNDRAGAIAHYRKAIELTDRPEPRAALAALLGEEPGFRDEAIRLYREALRIRPTYAEAHVGLANELVADPARREEAIEHYAAALKLRPKFGLARANLGAALAQTPGREEEAIAVLTEVLQAMPDHAPSHFHLANVLVGRPARREEAIHHYRRALELRSDAPDTQLKLAEALALAGRLPEAIAQYEELLRRHPSHATGRYNLANLLARSNRPADAIAHYEEAIKAKPDSAEIHANLANTIALLPGRLAEAFTHYERALELDPSLPWVHYNVALHLAELPELAADAAKHAEEAIRLDPRYVEALNLLGIIHARQKRPVDAREAWNRALQINPGFEPARRNLELLETAR